VLTGIGGSLMFVSGVLFFVVIIGTLPAKQTEPPEAVEMPVAETMHPEWETPRLLDRLGLWMVAAVVLVPIAYVPVLVFTEWTFPSPPWRLF
jgi:hypothetical protein